MKKHNIDIKNVSYLKVGGNVEKYYEIDSYVELVKTLNVEKKFIAIGNTSKIIFGFDNLTIPLIKFKVNKVVFFKNSFFCFSGISLTNLHQILKKKNITGFEFLATIPGTVGGSIVNNASFLNQCISFNLIKLFVYDQGKFTFLEKNQCHFSYRNSSLNKENFIIIGALFKINYSSETNILLNEQKAHNFRISHKHLYKDTLGSIFKNFGENSIGKTLDKLGYKGYKYSDEISISKGHANFLVVKYGANYHDVIFFLTFLRDVLYNYFKEEIEFEIQLIAADGKRKITRN